MARNTKVVEVAEVRSADEILKALRAEIAEVKAAQKAEQAQKKIERAEARKALLRNGEMPPKDGTTCALIWSVCFTYREEHGISPGSAYVKEQLPDVNEHTVQTQTARFRKYVGDTNMSTVVNDPFRKG